MLSKFLNYNYEMLPVARKAKLTGICNVKAAVEIGSKGEDLALDLSGERSN
jgi:hypothetical protein